ncbi:Outer membrane receptor for ferrienterochelin and colicins [Zobellia uliginosa]|uniref:Outer membrane receptor for ferrienterochelin and colicins n=1 Tax=Zobellia uliginosa TaxID=143224 RepID=A0ABY1KW00_9FLAO|nr:carboxypeptidase-like regulatory domain-containing protein [Zobellia uliginosa]SIS84777.1 Outer membrane receptor for ferrienterochelin and colicins [Zobellia uliginosa]
MAIKIRKLFHFLIALMSFFCSCGIYAQNRAHIPLTTYLQKLEHEFDIKFSYADDDIRDVLVEAPDATELNTILQLIESQTQVLIEKLNDRYYTLTRSPTIDICGTVYDNFKMNTLYGATVTVLGTAFSSIIDENGNFSFKGVPRDAKLQIKYLGYKTLFVNADELVTKEPCKTLLLAQYYQQLEEVVVYEFLTKGLIKQLDGSVQMNSKEFGILPGLIEPDVLQTVQALPGIKSIDETVSNINIRGGSNDQNLILWDGIKMYQSGHFFGLISAFNPYLTDKVTLIKNGSSSQYGDGVSGIIDMRTRDSIADTYFAGAGLNLIGGDVYAHLPLNEKLAVQFSARRSLTDFLDTPTYDKFFTRVFEDSQVSRDGNFYFYDFTGKLLYNIDNKHKLSLSFININNLLDYSERDMDTNDEIQSALSQTNLSLGASVKSEWNKRFSTSLNAYQTRYKLEAQNISGNAEQVLFQNNEVQETALKLNTNYSLFENLDWLNGYQFIETSISNKTAVTQPPYTSNQRDIVKSHVLFSELTYTSTDNRLYGRAGMRLNYLENPKSFTKYLLEPRLSINYAFTNRWKLQLLGEFKSQAINQVIDLEQNFLGIEKRRWIVSDDDRLPITQSKQGSIGINYDHKTLYLGLEAFYKEVNGISTLTQGFQNQDQFNGETGKYNVKGLEFLINRKTDDYSIWASYTYNLNNYHFSEVLPPDFPNNLDIRHTATFAGTYNIKNFKLGIGLNYRTGKPYTQPSIEEPLNTSFFPNRINYQEPNSSRLPEYLRADASAIYDFGIGKKLKASAGISVLNFTGRNNILNTYYRLNETNEIEKVDNVSLGLTPNASFRLRF